MFQSSERYLCVCCDCSGLTPWCCVPPQADLINQLYQGKLKDYVRCLECGYESWRIDTYLDIPLVIRPFGASQAYGSVVRVSLPQFLMSLPFFMTIAVLIQVFEEIKAIMVILHGRIHRADTEVQTLLCAPAFS